MATTKAEGPAHFPTGLHIEENQPVLTLLTEISESLKEINIAFKDHSTRLLRLENDGVGGDEKEGKLESSRCSQAKDSDDRRLVTQLPARLRSHRPHQSIESRSYISNYNYSDDGNLEDRVRRSLIPSSDRRERRGSTGSPSCNEVVLVEEDVASLSDALESKIPISREEVVVVKEHGAKPTSSQEVVVVVEEDESGSDSWEGGSQIESDDRKAKEQAYSTKSWRHPLADYTHEEVKYGAWPQDDLCQQLFGDLPSRENDQISAWLKEKRLIFPRDQRCSFTFDTVALAQPHVSEYSGVLDSVQHQIGKIEDFARDLRLRGGFFFFRESYKLDEEEREGNKIYNGTDVFRCEDDMKEALPKLSFDGKNFCEELEGEDSVWGSNGDDVSLREVMEKRTEMTELMETIHHILSNDNLTGGLNGGLNRDSDQHSSLQTSRQAVAGPSMGYLYRGERYRGTAKLSNSFPQAMRVYGNGWESPVRSTCWKFRDPHIIAPWRRLCVITGLSRIPGLDGSSIFQKVPLFPSGPIEGTFNVEHKYRTESESESDEHYEIIDNDDKGIHRKGHEFYETSILQHLEYQQLSVLHRSRRVCVKLQFCWYELIPSGKSEKRRYSGKLYRDDLNRSLQLQSFMAIATWKLVDEHPPRDCQLWTLVIMAPAFFYHRNKWDESNQTLIGPLQNILPTLSAIISDIVVRILDHWIEISEYVEQFIASQDTILHEDEHDRLLFDDDNFTRSRQYLWVISSIGEFISIIDATIHHYGVILNGIFLDSAEIGKHEELRRKLVNMKERFERQKERATALRYGLFNASAVVESRISTRLAQNVKFLTYVSIFYLPLGFCAALWAIPNITVSSTRTPFIVAAFLVGLTTYFTVFSLDSLASLGWERYYNFRTGRINQMRDDANDKWKQRGLGYNRFVPNRGNSKPSEWYILLYFILHPFKISPEAEIDKDSDNEDEKDESISSIRSRHTRSRGVSPDRNSTCISETSRLRVWKFWLQNLFEKLRVKPGEASEAEVVETSQREAWKAWIRYPFKKSEAKTMDTQTEAESREQEIVATWRGKAWKGLFKNSEHCREKNGLNKV